MDTSPVSDLLSPRGCRSPQLSLTQLQTPLPGKGLSGLGQQHSGVIWGAGRQRAPVSPPSSSPWQADGSIGARCPRGLSDGSTHTSAAQGLPLVLVCLNKLLYSKDFSALICISIRRSPTDSDGSAGCLPAPPASAVNPAVNRCRNLSLQLLADLQQNIFIINFSL